MSYSAGVPHPGGHSRLSLEILAPQVTASIAALGANLAVYVPVIILDRVIVRKLFVVSGFTTSGNLDIGLYNAAGSRLVASGSIAKVDSVLQSIDVTDTSIGPGMYYLALVSNSGTDTFGTVSLAAPAPAAYGLLTESVFPLPATATWTVPQTLAQVPSLGLFFVTLVS